MSRAKKSVPQIQPLAIATPEAAERLGLAVPTLNKWRMTGEGPPFIKAGRSVRYLVADLDAWMAARLTSSTTPKAAAPAPLLPPPPLPAEPAASRPRKPSKPPTPRGAHAPAIPCPGLRAAREARPGPPTIKAAAESFGWTRERWSSWERLGRAPRAALEQVAAAWGVDLEQLTAGGAQSELVDPAREVAEVEKLLRTALSRVSALVGRFS